MGSCRVLCPARCACKADEGAAGRTREEDATFEWALCCLFDGLYFPENLLAAMQKLAQMPNVTPWRLAVWFSKPIVVNGYRSESFLHCVIQMGMGSSLLRMQTLFDFLGTLPLCPHLLHCPDATGLMYSPIHVHHIQDPMYAPNQARRVYELMCRAWLLGLGGYPICGCGTYTACRRQDAACTQLLQRWHRWCARKQKRGWLWVLAAGEDKPPSKAATVAPFSVSAHCRIS
jgi:hypothetical protein